MFKPMKPPAGALSDDLLSTLRFPMLVQPKYDGIRCSVQGGKLLSSTLKLIPNLKMQALWGRPEFEGLDGEIIVGDPTASECFNRSSSFAGTVNGSIEGATFRVFDKFDENEIYLRRLLNAQIQVLTACDPSVRVEQHIVVSSLSEFLAKENEFVLAGHEGMMGRAPRGKYKQGRSTHADQWLIRRKPMEDGEATIVGTEEQLENKNETHVDGLGHTKRSSHKCNKVGKGMMGKYNVVGLTVFPGVKFNVGCFGTVAEQIEQWKNRDQLVGKILKFKFQRVGSLDAPRLPIAIGFREAFDIAPE